MKKKRQEPQELEHCAQDAASYLRGLANRYRLLILCSLLEGEKCVSDLLEELPISQPLISQHLKILRDEGIVESRKDAQKVIYSILDQSAAQILEALSNKYKG